MEHLPIFLRMPGRSALVVGDGDVAARKARLLVKTGAAVTVITADRREELRESDLVERERAEDGVEAMAARGDLVLLRRRFASKDVTGRDVVFVATGCEDADERVAKAARAAGVPVNVVDNKRLSTFIMPAIVDRDPITVAISSSGTAPVLARSIRARIEVMLPPRTGALARFADSFRSAVKANYGSGSARRRFWEGFFRGPVAAAVLDGDEARARERMLAAVNRPNIQDGGIVFIVGAGPGDPDLLTLRALRLLQEADVIVHDRLVSAEVLDYARRDADRIAVGKAKGAHSCSQEEINDILLRQARAGRRVVRLKGGDPFVFGRGGEEREFLLRHGVRTEVVPGITAATGCAAAAGIPLTHRDASHAMTVVTGHGKGGAAPDLDWAALAQLRQTLVVYMGASAAGAIATRLMEHGMDPATPVAVVANGTRADQEVRVGTLSELDRLAASVRKGAPAVLVIGEVAGYADAWANAWPQPWAGQARNTARSGAATARRDAAAVV